MAAYDYFGRLMPTTPWSSLVIKGPTTTGGSTVLSGTAGADNFLPNAATRLIGGTGDDTYQYVTGVMDVVELANGGTDTVYVNSSYAMPENVENLVVWWAPHVVGNALGNVVAGSSAGQTIDGGRGNDVLIGGGGSDTFIFSSQSGYDVITDFATGGTDADLVRLAGYGAFTSFAQVKAAMTQSGSDVILRLDGNNALKFSNQLVANFTDANFYLGLDKSNLKLTFADEFDGLSLWNGTSGTWRTNFGWGSNTEGLGIRTLSGNNEKQIYIDSQMKGTGSTPIGISPFSIHDGILTVTASPTPSQLAATLYNMNYVSGLLTTKQSFAQQYGYFEVRMKLPTGDGMWPAFWLLPTDGSWPPEIDVMENYGTEETSYTVHTGVSGNHTYKAGFSFDPNVGDDFHTYGLLWTATTLAWYLDGVKVNETATPADLNKPMYLLLNLAVAPWAANGQIDELEVDYVHAYSLSQSSSGGGAGTPGGSGPGGGTGGGVVPDPGQNLTGNSLNNVFVVDSPLDKVSDPSATDSDTVQSSIDFTLPVNLERLVLLGGALRGGGNDGANMLTGNDAANVLEGFAGNDTLDGKGGADRLLGGDGNDVYYIDNAGDLAIELAGQGIDFAYSAIDYTLAGNIEKLMLTGAALRGTGNELANIITGNALNNILVGGAGGDTMNGMEGADSMTGGADNDIYYVDNSGDQVIELANQGIDFVYSTIDYILPADVERLALTGTGALRGTGNGLSNVIRGNTGANLLSGDGGADMLYGDAGKDDLIGGAGADGFYFDTPLEPAAADNILDFSVIDDTIYLDRRIFASAGPAGVLPTTAFHVGTAAADSGDRVIYDQTKGNLYYDADGTGGVAAQLFAHVAPMLALTSADFVIF